MNIVSLTKTQRIVLITSMILCTAALAQDLSFLDKVQARITGPFHFRLIIQPLVALLIGIRDGHADALHKRPPILIHLITQKKQSIKNFRLSLISIQKPLLVGIVLDAIVQYYLFNSLRLLGAILVGIILVAMPYLLARGIFNRMISLSSR